MTPGCTLFGMHRLCYMVKMFENIRNFGKGVTDLVNMGKQLNFNDFLIQQEKRCCYVFDFFMSVDFISHAI